MEATCSTYGDCLLVNLVKTDASKFDPFPVVTDSPYSKPKDVLYSV